LRLSSAIDFNGERSTGQYREEIGDDLWVAQFLAKFPVRAAKLQLDSRRCVCQLRPNTNDCEMMGDGAARNPSLATIDVLRTDFCGMDLDMARVEEPAQSHLCSGGVNPAKAGTEKVGRSSETETSQGFKDQVVPAGDLNNAPAVALGPGLPHRNGFRIGRPHFLQGVQPALLRHTGHRRKTKPSMIALQRHS
jgi:hypothetical protein